MSAGPGAVRASWIVASKDLRLEGRTFDALSSMLLFALIVLVVFSFALDLPTLREVGVGKLLPGVLWTTFAFAGIVAFSRSFQVEKLRDSLSALALAPIERGAIFAGKALSNLILLSALEALLLPLSALFFDYDLLGVLVPLAAVVLLHTLGIAELGTLFAAVAARVGRGEILLATLLFPVATPLFISAVQCTAAVLEGRGLGAVRLWLLVTAGFDVLYFFVALVTFEFVLEE